MRRDAELARTILLAVEAMPSPDTDFIVAGDYSADQVSYHVELLREAGLLLVATGGGTLRQPRRAVSLTWRGHEFLDLVRREEVWLYLRDRRALVLPFELLEGLAFQFWCQQLGIRAATGATGDVDGSVIHKGA